MIINRYKFEGFVRVKVFVAEHLVPNVILNKYNAWKYMRLYKKEIGALLLAKLPYNIQIETINRCNGECPFCPVNRKSDTRPYAKMTTELYEKIIDELETLQYDGQLALFSNNEPLLDVRLVEFAKYAREKLPSAFIYIFTNGTLVNVDIIKKLANYLDEIVIDNYNDTLELNENIVPINELCEQDEKINKIVKIHLRKLNEVLNNRGGSSPNAQQRWKRAVACLLPFSQMIIRPDGKVSLCCNDALGKNTLGDVNEMSLAEIWNSDKYKQVRRMIENDIQKIEICACCDAYYKM